jgi:prepilin-type N-terminal cleavage/methylation domain-containing protein
MWAKRKTQGFTIVELLIVIVVIAILAAITIVAYNGIQQRANNTRRIAAAKDWQKIITAYTSTNGTYPASTLNNHTCLGTGYPTDLDVNPDEDCLGTGNVKHPLTSINTAYATIGTLPKFPGDKLVSSSSIGTTAGISLRSVDTLDAGTATEKLIYPFLYYWLVGTNQDCVLRPVVVGVSGGYSVSTTAINTLANEGGITRCMIALPDPSGL